MYFRASCRRLERMQSLVALNHVLSWKSGMRLYFHLADAHDVIPDPDGTEVADLHQARIEAVRAIAELKAEDPSIVQEWTGWRLDVTNAAGAVVLSISLTDL